MKRFKYISFNYRGITTTEIVKVLKQCGLEEKVSELRSLAPIGWTSVDAKLKATDPRVGQLLRAMHGRGIECFVRDEITYEPKDLASASHVWMQLNRNGVGSAGPFSGTEYDTSEACPDCFSGARQTSALRLGPRDLPKKARIVEVPGGGFIMDAALAEAIRIEIRGERGLRQTEDRKSKKKLPWWQILPDITLPPLAPFTPGIETENQCQTCKRSGFFGDADTPLKPIYQLRRKERDALPDFLSTWECFGHSLIEPGNEESGYALPHVIVSNRVMKVFQKEKVQRMEFVPVLFEDPDGEVETGR